MRVLEICTRFYPAIGGVETDTWITSKHLVRQGHEVAVWTSDLYSVSPRTRFPVGMETIEGIAVHRLKAIVPPGEFAQDFVIVPGHVFNWVGTDSKFDVVHVHGYRFFTAIGQLLGHARIRAKIVLSPHCSAESSLARQVYDRILGRQVVREASQIVCQTQAELELMQKLGCSADRLSIIPPGPAFDEATLTYPLATFPGTPIPVSTHRYILSYGRLAANKGLESLILATVPLLRADSNLFLVIAGEDHGILPRLTDLVVRNGVEGQVIFTGRVTASQAAALIYRATIFVFPSLGGEAYGMTLLTAMQSGKPVIATSLPGPRDLIVNGENGFLFGPGDSNGLRGHLLSLLEDPVLAENVGRRAAESTRDFTWHRATKQLESVLLRAAAEFAI